MNGDPNSHGLWEASAPTCPASGALREHIEVEVAIIGAGFTGTSAALHLAEGGMRVAILEAQEVGFGASGRNVGLVNAGMWVMPSVLMEHLGTDHGKRLLELLGNAPSVVFELVRRHGIACEPVRNGTLHCAVGNAGVVEVTERTRQWMALGAPVELCDAQRTRALTGTGAYKASLLDRRAGTIQPLAYVRGLATAAMQAGASLYTHTWVTGARKEGENWHLETASGASVSAKWVIVATDAYTATNGLWSGIRTEQVKLPYFNLATSPLPRHLSESILPLRHGLWDTRHVLSSLRFDAAGRLVFGSVGSLRGAGRAIHHDWGRRALARLFPALKDIQFEHEWYGTIGMTQDALPRLHFLDHNVVSFSGFNGRGIAPGTVFGRELARLILGDIHVSDLPLPVTPVTRANLRILRELGYETGAKLFHAVDARI
ncbi:FAD-binding oxidoreductase [Pandoraea eparura]|uniref:FAD-binding oxidoreductase n=1 Tax=Pandoraea eparura TaxID=2508291 RepID=A0A5E4RBS3_9BURK|nr:FAD-binding oxidoreductase [Pandoraea eparura]VVD60826.1 FAD-binding oxidoreductase [Pandoraea eparura]